MLHAVPPPSSPRHAQQLALAVDALWAAAGRAQLDGDHARAEGLFATLVRVCPDDAEAWLARAIAAGWAGTPGKNRFDEVKVGVGVALECAAPAAKPELRRRAARAAALLAEVAYDEGLGALGAKSRLAEGRAALRLLDFAMELDATHDAAARAALRIAGDLLDLARDLDAPGPIFTSLIRAQRAAARLVAARAATVS